MKTISCVLGIATLMLVSASAWPKSQTIKLEIVGPGLLQPLEITDRAVLDRFSIWNGPGVRVNDQPIHLEPANIEQIGAFIDWSRGAVPQQPSSITPYTVTFHQVGGERMHDWHRRYVVTYAYDPASEGGYIYLPGPKDGDVYKRNVFSIVHGVEGNWFHASPAWERSVRPLIQQQISSPAAHARSARSAFNAASTSSARAGLHTASHQHRSLLRFGGDLAQRLFENFHGLTALNQVTVVDDDGRDRVDALSAVELFALADLLGVKT